jgi:hypothetical protein
VFGRFFGSKSSILPTPPKNQIEVVCPSCGAAQYEPRLVVSTFCKKCGVHLTVQKKRVTASEVTRSGAGAGMADPWADEAPPTPPSQPNQHRPKLRPAPLPHLPPPRQKTRSPLLTVLEPTCKARLSQRTPPPPNSRSWRWSRKRKTPAPRRCVGHSPILRLPRLPPRCKPPARFKK